MTESHHTPYDDLEVWLNDRHPAYETKLKCREVEGAGRGMFAEEDIAPGSTLLLIPSSALLNPLSIRACPLNTIPLHLFPLPTATSSTPSGASKPRSHTTRIKGRKRPQPPATSSATGPNQTRPQASSSSPSPPHASSSSNSPPTPTKPIHNPKRKRLSIASRLNTTQLLTLHLLLTRDPLQRHPSGWEVYIRTLPRFDSHPLSWLYPAKCVSRNGATGECGQEAGTGAKAGLDGVKVNESKAGESGASGETHEQVSWEEGSAVRPGTKGVWSWYGESPDADANPQLYTDSDLYVKNEAETSTAAQRGASTSTNTNERPRMKQSEATPLECLTRGGMTKLLEVQERYEGDKAAILTVLRAEEPFKSQGIVDELYEHDLLWAWLNVNTRSVSIPLGLPHTSQHTQNHTLVPILDMLNHSSDVDRVISDPRQVPSAPSPICIPSKSTPSQLDISISTSPCATSPCSAKRTGPAPLSAPGRPVHANGPGPATARTAGTHAHLVPGKIGLQLVAPFRGIKAGEEVVFTYGPHCSATLFAEYGFSELSITDGDGQAGSRAADETGAGQRGDMRSCNGRASPDGTVLNGTGVGNREEARCNWPELANGQLDVGWLVDELWDEMEDEGKEEKVDALRVIGCFQRNTLHTSPSPPHPSHSLLMTLRILHHPSPIPSLRLRAIRSGSIVYFGPEVEAQAMASLREICERVLRDTELGMDRIRRFKQQVKRKMGQGEEAYDEGMVDAYILQQLEALWVEQGGIARSVLERVESGDTDW